MLLLRTNSYCEQAVFQSIICSYPLIHSLACSIARKTKVYLATTGGKLSIVKRKYNSFWTLCYYTVTFTYSYLSGNFIATFFFNIQIYL
jgi:hypothetical protein